MTAARQAPFDHAVTSRLASLTASLPGSLRPAVTDLVQRPGKRLRSTMLAACAQYGTAEPGRLARVGALVELLHIASLLHDDVVDRAETRRGRPAAQLAMGPELALLAGLACVGVVGTEAAELGAGASLAVGRIVANLSYGQMLDVERAFDTTLAVSDYVEMIARKTADLFRLCCVLGAAEARLDPDEAQRLASFGTEIGLAFQVLDDCLDLEPTDAGKPAGTDHLLGLFGAPTLFALHNDSSGDLRELLLDPGLRAADLQRIQALVAALDGLAAARRLAGHHWQRAITTLDGMANQTGRAALLTAIEPIRGRL